MPSLPKGCPVTLTLVAANILFFSAQFASQDMLTNMGLLYGPYVQSGEFWRIVSSGFLHGSILHIGFNMYLLYLLGPQLEQGLGSLRFGLIYFGSLLGGTLAVLTFDFIQPTLGASGAVLGLAGAMFVTLWGRGVSPMKSPAFGLVVLNLALPLLVPGISFWGHFGGVAAGAALAFVMVWMPDRSRKAGAGKNISQGTAVVILLTVACFAVVQIS
jgi:membrane associated rhomboid family serine protease